MSTPTQITPVTFNASGTYSTTITNVGSAAWPSGSFLYVQVDRLDGSFTGSYASVSIGPLSSHWAQTVTMSIPATTLGYYSSVWDLYVAGANTWMSTQGVCSPAYGLDVEHQPPSLSQDAPGDGGTTTTRTPTLSVTGWESDGYLPGPLTYRFTVCSQADMGGTCFGTAFQSSDIWQVPAGDLAWGQTYYWSADVFDTSYTTSSTEYGNPGSEFTVVVPTPTDASRQVGAGLGLATVDNLVLPSGVFVETATDAQVQGAGTALKIDRTYSSGEATVQGAFGDGWMSIFDSHAVWDSFNQLLQVTYPDGRQENFGYDSATGQYAGRTDLGDTNRVQRTPAGATTVTETSGEIDAFDTTGALADVNFPGAGSWSVVSSGGRISSIVQQPSGRRVDVSWATQPTTGCTRGSIPTAPYVASLSVPQDDGDPEATWTYGYDCNRLISVTNPDGGVTHYTTSATSFQGVTPMGRPLPGLVSAGSWSESADANGISRQVRSVVIAVPGSLDHTILLYKMPTEAVTNSYIADLYLGNYDQEGGTVAQYCIEPTVVAGAESCAASPTVMSFDQQGRLFSETQGIQAGVAADITTVRRLWGYVSSNGQLTDFIDENDNDVSYLYDGAGNPTGSLTWRDPYTAITSQSYVDSTTDRLTGTYVSDMQASNQDFNEYAYNTLGQLTQRVGPPTPAAPTGEVSLYTYTTGQETAVNSAGVLLTGQHPPAGLIASETTGAGVTTFSYDTHGDETVETPPGEQGVLRSYDATGLEATETDPIVGSSTGALLTLKHDLEGRVTEQDYPCITDPITHEQSRRVVQYAFDLDGLPTTVDDRARDCANTTDVAPQRLTTTEYNSSGQVSRVTDASGGVSSYTYEPLDPTQVASTTDARGRVTDYTYDARGSVSQISADVGKPGATHQAVIATYQYDNAERLVAESDADGRITDYTYTEDDYPASASRPGVVLSSGGAAQTVPLWSREYDGEGHVVSETDGALHTTTYAYDSEGRLQSTTVDPLGVDRTTTTIRDAAGRTTEETLSSPAGTRWLRYTVDAAGNPLSATTGPLIRPTTLPTVDLVRDPNTGLVTGTVDPRGVAVGNTVDYTTTTDYDALDRPSKQVGAPIATTLPSDAVYDGSTRLTVRPTTTVGYDAFGDVTEQEDADGNITTAKYDAAGRKVEQDAPSYTAPGSSNPTTAVTTWSYSSAGDLLATTDARGGETDYTYDIAGNQLTVTSPAVDGQRAVTTNSYDDLGQLTATVAPDGGRALYGYDALGDLVDREQFGSLTGHLDERVWVFAYDAAGDILSAKTPAGVTTGYTYDGAGEVTHVSVPGRRFGDYYTYNEAGQVLVFTDGSTGTTTTNTYDVAGNVATSVVKGSSGATQTTSYTYDLAGNRLTQTDPMGVTTSYVYDAANHLTQTTQPVSATDSIVTKAGFDAAGNAVLATDGDGNSTWTTYNTWNLPESTVQPATSAHPALADRTTTVAYDGDQNAVLETAPSGTTVVQAFDARNELTSQAGHGPPGGDTPDASNDYSYDPVGRLASENFPGGTQNFTWDLLGDLTSSTGPAGDTSFGYNGDGALTQQATTAGTTNYVYDGAGRLTSATDSVTGIAPTWTYETVDGHLTSVNWQDSSSTNYQYDQFGRLSLEEMATDGGESGAFDAQQTDYTYDADNRIVGKAGQGGVAAAAGGTYGYDESGRLTSWMPQVPGDVSPQQVSYSYDDANNRLSESTPDGASTTWSHDARDELTGITSTAADGTNSTRSVDDNPDGTIASIGSGSSAEKLTFDALGQLTADGAANYAYDGLGRLASRTQGATTADFGYAGLQSQPYSAPDTAGGIEVATRDPNGALLATSNANFNRATTTDAHGDVIGGTSTLAGDGVIAEMFYDPTGVALAGSATLNGHTADTNQASAYGFQGEWTDPATANVNMAARWYDPAIGSFLSADSVQTPLEGASGNPYEYGDEDPLDNVDPSGHRAVPKPLPVPDGPAPDGPLAPVTPITDAPSYSPWGEFWSELGADASALGGEVGVEGGIEGGALLGGDAIPGVDFVAIPVTIVVGVVGIVSSIKPDDGPGLISYPYWDPESGVTWMTPDSGYFGPPRAEVAPQSVTPQPVAPYETSTGVRTSYSSQFAVPSDPSTDVISGGYRISTTTWEQVAGEQPYTNYSDGSIRYGAGRVTGTVIDGTTNDYVKIVDPSRITADIVNVGLAPGAGVSDRTAAIQPNAVDAPQCGITGTLASCITGSAPLQSQCAGPGASTQICLPVQPMPGRVGGVQASTPSTTPGSSAQGGASMVPGATVPSAAGGAGMGGSGGGGEPPDECEPDDGVVYLRSDGNGGKPYVGQAKSLARFEARQLEHARANPFALFSFRQIGTASPGAPLDRLEQYYINQGNGPTNAGNPEGGLANKRNQMTQQRYEDNGGDPEVDDCE